MANEISFPWEMFSRVNDQKARNRQQAYQGIEDIGQGLGQGLTSIGDLIGTIKKKQLMDQIVQAMSQQGAPQQGPPLAPPGTPQPSMSQIPSGQPMTAGAPNVGQDVQMPQPIPTQTPGMQPTSGIGAPAQDNTQLVKSLLMKYNPEAMTNQMIKGFGQTSKQNSPWRVVSGMLSKNGKPVQQNEATGEVREASLDVQPTGRGNSSFGTGSINWDSATDEDKNIAKALYEGRVRPGDLGYRDRSVGVKLANEYALKSGFPPFKAYAGNVAGKTAEAFATGKFGQNVNSLNTALGHVDSAYKAYQDIGNTNQEWLNVPINKLKTSTNDPNVVRLGITLNALQGELATVFKGSAGTDQEISSWMKYLNENLTPEQVNGAIPQVDELLRSRLSALDYQRSSGMSGRGESPLLSPHGASISKKFGSSGMGKTFPSVQAAEAANLPKGTKVTINGRSATIQ